jgi:FkbM family methyltransferase
MAQLLKPGIRRIAAPLGWILAGAVAAAPATIVTVRASRDPSSMLFRLRERLGVSPASTEIDSAIEEGLDPAYEPGGESLGFEQWIVRDFFRDKRNGVFADIGAADYRDNSNTWFLETELGWSGIAVDAQDSYRAGWEEHRPRTRFLTFFVSDHSNGQARLYLSQAHREAASYVESHARSDDPLSRDVLDVPTITLNDLFQAQGLQALDFLSLDVELAEPQALAGFDIRRYRPQLVCVEAHPPVRQDILNYFNRNGYVLVAKYLRVDSLNLWFMPLAADADPETPRLP